MPRRKKSSRRKKSYRKTASRHKSSRKSRKSSRRRKSSRKSRKSASYSRIKGHGSYGIVGAVGRGGKSVGRGIKKAYSYVPRDLKIKAGAYGGGILGGTVGGILGGPQGAYVGGIAGGAAGGYIAGHGDYMTNTVSENTIALPGTQVPTFGKSGRHGVRVRHREYIKDISGSTSTFANQVAEFINPGNKNLFPWLSGLAVGFQQFEFEGLCFFTKSLSGSATGTNTGLGFQLMCTNYDAAAPQYPDKRQGENSEWAVSNSPNSNMIHCIECSRRETVISELYVTSGAVPSGQDPRLYHMGLFQLFTGGQQGGNTLSELWCTYDVMLYNPIIGFTPSDAWAIHAVAAGGLSNSNPFGTTQTLRVGNSASAIFSGLTITLPTNTPLGTYQLIYQMTGTSTACTVPTLSYTGASAVNFWVSDTTSELGLSYTTTQMLIVATFTVTASSPVITFSSLTGPSTPTSSDVFITLLPTLLTT